MEKLSFPKMRSTGLTYSDLLQARVDAYNALKGTLTGYHCDKCNDKGNIAYVEEEQEIMRSCSCMKTRDTLRRIRESGLEDLLRIYTFSNFEAVTSFQKHMKQSAADFLQQRHKWFFIGGQTGCGKTHICTAMVGGFIKQGLSVRYLVWQEDANRLKFALTDGSYCKQIAQYKEADVLYIDDLFKVKDNCMKEITNADVKIAFELLDYRGRNQMTTILSTEWTTPQLMEIDEAITGRIIKMAQEYSIDVKKDRAKNYRLKGVRS